jgi:hypothetical protein
VHRVSSFEGIRPKGFFVSAAIVAELTVSRWFFLMGGLFHLSLAARDCTVLSFYQSPIEQSSKEPLGWRGGE